MEDLRIKLVTYKNMLVIEIVGPEDITPDWIERESGWSGYGLRDTKRYLGVSAEALEWLQKVPQMEGGGGEIDWFAEEDGTKTFRWIGGLYAVLNRDAMGTKRDRVFAEDCVTISNEVPFEAKHAIDCGPRY